MTTDCSPRSLARSLARSLDRRVEESVELVQTICVFFDFFVIIFSFLLLIIRKMVGQSVVV